MHIMGKETFLCATFLLLTLPALMTAQLNIRTQNPPTSTLPVQGIYSNSYTCYLYNSVYNGYFIPVPGGYVKASCLRSQRNIISILLEQGLRKNSRAQFMALWRKALRYFRRDRYASICVLTCTTGQPFPRSKHISDTSVVEPTYFNVGCDDWQNLKCSTTCPIIDSSVENGKVNCSQRNLNGSVCTLQCNSGYVPVGDLSRKQCLNTNWSSQQPFQCQATCQIIDSSVENGKVNCSQRNLNGSVCTLQCNSGYVPVGDLSRKQCLEASWSSQQPFQCKALHLCPLPKPIENGRLQRCSSGNEPFSKCSLLCHFGFQPTGEQICLPDSDGRSAWYISTDDRELRCDQSTEELDSGIVSGYGIVLNETTTVSLNRSSAALQRYAICDVSYDDRRQCKGRRVKPQDCERKGCCWDANWQNSFHCYHRAKNPVNQALKSHVSASLVTSTSPGDTLGSKTLAGVTPPVANPRSHQFGPVYNTAEEAETALQTGDCGCSSHPCRNQGGCHSDSTSRCLKIALTLTNEDPISPKVYCGDNTGAVNWPWNAMIYYNGNICGGTLIAPQYVLTAAHCLLPADGSMDGSSQNYVFLGLTDTRLADTAAQSRHIWHVERHPNFTLTSLGSATDDLAIIKLLSPANVTGDSVRPLCLPQSRYPRLDDECYVTGFGKTTPTSVRTSNLQQARMPYITFTQCHKYFPGSVAPGHNICGGYLTYGSPNTCKGDSGGPLVCKRKGASCGWFLSGVISFGKDPCGTVSPTVFVNIYHYQKWIFDAVHRLSLM